MNLDLKIPADRVFTGISVSLNDSGSQITIMLTDEYGYIGTVDTYDAFAIHFTLNGNENLEGGLKFTFRVTGEGWLIESGKKSSPVLKENSKFLINEFFEGLDSRAIGVKNPINDQLAIVIYKYKVDRVSYWLENADEVRFYAENGRNEGEDAL